MPAYILTSKGPSQIPASDLVSDADAQQLTREVRGITYRPKSLSLSDPNQQSNEVIVYTPDEPNRFFEVVFADGTEQDAGKLLKLQRDNPGGHWDLSNPVAPQWNPFPAPKPTPAPGPASNNVDFGAIAAAGASGPKIDEILAVVKAIAQFLQVPKS